MANTVSAVTGRIHAIRKGRIELIARVVIPQAMDECVNEASAAHKMYKEGGVAAAWEDAAITTLISWRNMPMPDIHITYDELVKRLRVLDEFYKRNIEGTSATWSTSVQGIRMLIKACSIWLDPDAPQIQIMQMRAYERKTHFDYLIKVASGLKPNLNAVLMGARKQLDAVQTTSLQSFIDEHLK